VFIFAIYDDQCSIVHLYGMLCRFAHVDTTAEDARRMCSTLNGTCLRGQTKKLNVTMARSSGKPATSAHSDHAGSASVMPTLSQQQAPSLPHTTSTSVTSPTSPVANSVRSLDSMYLSDPAVISSTPHCSPRSAAADQCLSTGGQTPASDSATKDRWRPAHGKMDSGSHTDGMHQHRMLSYFFFL